MGQLEQDVELTGVVDNTSSHSLIVDLFLDVRVLLEVRSDPERLQVPPDSVLPRLARLLKKRDEAVHLDDIVPVSIVLVEQFNDSVVVFRAAIIGRSLHKFSQLGGDHIPGGGKLVEDVREHLDCLGG